MLDASTITATVAILSWYATNIFTVVLNKYLFQMINFTFPLTLTAIHMLVSTIGSLLAVKVFKLVPFQAIPRDKLMTNILPLGYATDDGSAVDAWAVFCVNIILGNISLRWIPVSFMQTVKSLVPAFTVLLQTLLLKQYSSRLTYLSLVPVVGGVALASFTEVNFEFIGFMAALIASLTTSVQSIVSSMLLTGALKLDSINLLYYMAPVSFVCQYLSFDVINVLICPIALVSELEMVLEYDFAEYGANKVFFNLLISGIVAYLLRKDICVFFAIKSTSPLTFTVFGNLKVVAVIGISVLIFKNEITWWNGFGCVIATIGIIWYNAIEYQIKEAKKLAAQAQQKKDRELESSTESLEIQVDKK